MEKYRRHGRLVEGRYGVVYIGVHKVTEGRYLIKEFSPAGVDAGLREISTLQQFGPNSRFTINLIEHHFCPGSRMPLKIIYELIPSDLRHYIGTHRNLPPQMIQSIMYQILLGLDFIHGRGVMHRNLRSDLILLTENGQEVRLKLADFRSSKSRGVTQQGAEGLTPPSQIHRQDSVNRAPELLLGAAEYKPAVDIWSAGCIFAEITSGHKLFHDRVPMSLDEDTAQLLTIFSILGTPSLSEREILGVDNLINMNKVPRYERATLAVLMELVPGLTLQGADLLNKMLQYIPEERSTASMLLNHDFFQGLNRNQFQ